MNKLKNKARTIRLYRKIHGTMGGFLFLVFLLISLSGLLLGWKKHSGGLILPKSYQGVSKDLRTWLPIDSLHQNALKVFRDSISNDLSTTLDRIDIRPDKGMVKFVFTEHYWGIQLDGTTGELLQIERRRSDFIENIHDGSILDYVFETDDGQIKLIYTSITGLTLLIFSLTGFWLYYGPLWMRRKRQSTVPLPTAGKAL